MKVHEILNEVLDSKVDVKVHEDSKSTYFFSADIAGRTIQFQADKKRGNKWFMDFWQLDKKTYAMNYDLTGAGGELKVFSVMKDAVLHLIQKHKPAELKFEAENKTTRANLYEKFLKRLNIPGYKYERQQGKSKDIFVLTPNEKLDEILNRKVDYEVTRNGKDFRAEAKIGDRIIHFAIEKDDDDKDGDAWEAVFWQTNLQGNGMNFGKTGGGNELEVFSMVSAALKQFIEDRKPEKIFFSADKKGTDTNRAELYDRLVKRFKLPGYEYNRITKSHKDTFVLQRTQK